VDAPSVIVTAPGPAIIPDIVLQDHGTVQLTPQLEISSGSTTPFTASCTESVTTSVDSVTRTLPAQSVSVNTGTTEDYDSSIVVDNGGAGNTITVTFSCSVTSASGATINASATAIS
jgi:hypothetical protein